MQMPEFTLTTSDGVDLRARWHAPVASSRIAIVLVHGFTGSMDHPEVMAVAEALAADGYDVISYDARGHRGSGGFSTLGDAEQHDVAAAVRAARARYDHVVTVGASMGAIAALRHAAATEPGLAGVVAISSPARWKLPRNLRAVLATALTRTRMGRRFAARKLGVRIHPVWGDPPSPEEVASLIRVPLAVIHGDADQMIPLSEAHRLAAAARGPLRLDIVPGMRHAFDPAGIPAILASVRWALAGGPPAATAG